MQTQVFKGRANYEPNSLSDAGEDGGPREDPKGGFRSAPAATEGHKVRLRSETFADHYSHARLFFRSQSPIEQAHLASAIVFELSKVTLPSVRQRVLSNLLNVDQTLAERVAKGLNLPLPNKSAAAVEPVDMALSPALRIIGRYPETLKGRSVGLLVSDGADRVLVDAVREAVLGEGARLVVVAPKVGGVELSDGSTLLADAQLAGAPSVIFDAVVLALSDAGCGHLINDSAAIDFVSHAFAHLKAIGYAQGALPLLKRSGVTLDDPGVVDLTGGTEAFLSPARTRQWDREAKVRPLA